MGRQTDSKWRASYQDPVSWMGWLLTTFYFLRNSIISNVFPRDNTIAIVSYALLILTVLFGVFYARRIGWAGVFLLVLCAPGVFLSEDRALIWKKALGWMILVLALGPLLHSPRIRQLREAAWKLTSNTLVLISVISCGWYIIGGPVLGRGVFTGVMTHAMLVGPMSGMAALVAFAKGLTGMGKDRFWYLVALASGVPLLASGSRVAVISTLIGGLMVFGVAKKRMSLILPLLLTFCLGIYSIRNFAIPEQLVPDEATGTLLAKGTTNTREELWKARWVEFKAHPIAGIGIAAAKDEGVDRESTGSINVEPGSSYMAILSMTGSLGAIGFALFMAGWGSLCYTKLQYLPSREACILIGIGAFLATHAVAEGWLMAIGSPLCFIFWLWMGHSTDQFEQAALPAPRSAGSRRRKHRTRSLKGNFRGNTSHPLCPN